MSRHRGHGRLEVADRPEHIGPGPRRTRRGEPVDDLVDGDRRRAARRARCRRPSMAATSRLGVQPSSAASAGPPCPQIRDTVAGLVGAGVGRRLPGTARPVPTVVGSRPSRRRNSPTLTASAASTWPARLENTVQQLARQAGDLGLAVDDRLPRHPVAVGQLGSQHRLVQAAQHPLVPLQVAGVQRQPPAVVGLDLGRDDGVGVQLRVVGPRRRLAERGHRQPERVGVLAAAVDPHPGRRPEPLQMLERRRTATSCASSSPGSPRWRVSWPLGRPREDSNLRPRD